jgi:uncharacterized protein YjdB/PKD repeat protein
MVMERLRRLSAAALVALATLGLSLAGCAPEFTDTTCETDQDCFPGERCNRFNECVPGGGDAGPDGGDVDPMVDSIAVDPADATIQIGTTVTLDATALDADDNEITDVDFDWSSDATDVATVDDSGVVTGVTEGEAIITVSANGVSTNATITVAESTVDSVELGAESLEIFVDESFDVDATALDAEGNEVTDAEFVWSVGDDTIATVDEDGVITGVSPGDTTLTVNSSGVEATIDVTVLEIPVDRVEISPAGPHTIEEGSDDLDLDAVAFDEDDNELTGRDVTWESSDDTIASVDVDGVVTGESVGGPVDITATIGGVSEIVTVEVVEGNQPPTADAGSDITVAVNETVTLDGGGSNDPNNDTLSYSWSITAAPAGTNSTLSSTDTETTELTPDTAGDYTVELTVDDGNGGTATDTVTITANVPPSFSSTPVTSVDEDSTYTYDITTTDPEGDTRSIGASTQGGGALPGWLNFTDNGNGTATLTGTPTNADVGTYDIELSVADGVGQDTQTFTITVNNTNDAPTASFTFTPASPTNGDTVDLDGSGSSDPDAGDSIASYDWVVTDPSGNTSNLTGATPSFTADETGDWTVELTVTDGNSATGTDTQTITVTALPNSAPTFTSTEVTSVDEDSTYTYNITTNDADGDSVTISAALQGGGSLPAWLSFTDNGDGTADLTGTPTNADVGTYDIELTVSDSVSTGTQTFTITVNNTNDAPTASFTFSPASPTDGDTVDLDGTGSSDPDAGDSIASYDWVVTDPSNNTTNLNGATPSFTADAAGDWMVELTVTDGNSATGVDTQTITVAAAANNAPTFTSTEVTTATEDTTYTYNITTNDADGDSVTITGGLQGGGALPGWLTLTDNGDGTATLTGTPTNADVGTYNIELTVDDGTDSNTQAFTITVSNTNDAPTASFTFSPASPTNGQTVDLDGSGSSDPDMGDSIASYDWVVTDPSSNTTNLTGATPSFTADETGDWMVELTVTDGNSATGVDTQTITVAAAANNAPTFTSTEVTAATEDSTYTYNITTNDADGDSVTITGGLQGGGALPGWLMLTDNGDGTADLTGTPTNADVGTYDIELTVDDGTDSNTQAFTITVSNTNDAPTASFTFSPASPTVGETVNLDGSGSSDPDMGDSIASYDWVVTDPSSNTTNLTGATPSFTADEAGDWTVELTVTDGNTATGTDTQTITVVAAGSLIISEYIEDGNSKAIELYNNTGGSVDLTNFGVCVAQNDLADCDQDIDLTGTLADGATLKVCYNQIPTGTYDTANCDVVDSGLAHNGDDRIWIYEETGASTGFDSGDTTVDAFGQIDTRPGSTIWGDKVYRRCWFDTFDGTSAFTATDYYTETASAGDSTDYTDFGTAPTETCAP